MPISVLDVKGLDRNEYNKFIASSIIESLEDRLGLAAIQSINIYLKRDNLRFVDICNYPDKIRNAIYSMLGIGAYRLEYDIVRFIYDILGLRLVSITNLIHAIKIANVYFDLLQADIKDSMIDDILSLINMDFEPKNCKCCGKSLSVETRYEGLLTELCNKCYDTYEDSDTLDEDLR